MANKCNKGNKSLQLYISLIPTRSRSGRIPDTKTGPKLHEQLGRQAFRHDVRELVGRWNMKDPNLSQGHLFADEVNVDLDMLRATMMDRVGGHIDRADVVTINKRRRSNGDVELLEKLSDPATLGDGVGDRPVLGLSTGVGDRSLPL